MKKVSVRKDGSVSVATKTEGESLTQQQFVDMTDINKIMARALKTGVMPVSNAQPQFSLDEPITDYHSSLQKVLDANAAFMQLDPRVRARFENDPGQLLEFLNDESNKDEAIALGLLNGPAPISGDNANLKRDQPGNSEPGSKS